MKDKFDLQLFAADGGGEGGTGGDGGNPAPDNGGEKGNPDNGGKDKDTPKGISEEEMQKRIDDALAKGKAKWEKEYQKKAEKAKKEQDRLSKLSEDERAKAELENNRKELEAREAELKKKELKLEMVKVLTERNIPVQFLDYLVDTDNESTMKRITTFEKAYKKAIEDGVNEKLKGKPPQAGGTNKGNPNNAGVKNGFFAAIFKNQAKR